MQDFESESLTIGVEHSQKVKATPSVSDYGSKDCAFCPDPTAVSRIIPREWLRKDTTYEKCCFVVSSYQ